MPGELYACWRPLQVPDPGNPIVAGCRDQVTIGREGHALYLACMPMKDTQGFAGRNIPQPGCPIMTTCQQEATIWREGDPIDEALMAGEFAHQCPAGNIPHSGDVIVAAGS